MTIFWRSIQGEGTITFSHYLFLLRPLYLKSLVQSIFLSLLTAFLGMLFGFPAALALQHLLSHRQKNISITLAATAANFAGVPLAVAFMILLGLNGFLTRLLFHRGFMSSVPFTLYSFTGLVLLYLYFQIPLFVVLIMPALEGLRKEWREAVSTLGGNGYLYWVKVGFPVLSPALLGCFILLYANSFGAYATAFALVGAKFRLLPIQISLAVAGNVGYDPHAASAMAMVMIAGLLVLFSFYIRLRKRFALWVSG